MEICSLCGKLKSGAETCTDYKIIVQGIIHSPVRYKTKKYNPFSPEDSEMRCPVCNVVPDGLHHVGCGIEICPVCGGFWISCGCLGIKQKNKIDRELSGNIFNLKAEASKRGKNKK